MDHPSRAAAYLRWRPEWPFAGLVAAAWIALLAGAAAHGGAPPPGHEHHHHAHATVLGALPGWALMTVAMMVPVTLPAVRHVGLNSIRARRTWAMALYVTVYVAVWVAFGVVVLAGEHALRAALMVDDRALLALALALAGTWQLTRAKRRSVLRCKQTVPLPPVGRRADAGCARFAVAQAWRCLRSCWALMVVMAFAGHTSLVWMAVLSAAIAVEELTLAGRRLLGHYAAALGLAAIAVGAGV